MKRVLYWLPRTLAIGFIGFLSLFAFDVFAMEGSWYQLLGGFLIHLTPSFLLLGVLLIAWKRETIGGIVFILLSVIFTFFFQTYLRLDSFLLISFPVFITGLLFLLNRPYVKGGDVV